MREKPISTKLLDAVNAEIIKCFPDLTVHRRGAPSGFNRPCTLITVNKIKNSKETDHILNSQIIIRVFVCEELDEYNVPLEQNIKETLMEWLVLGDLAENAEGFSVEAEDKGFDETGVAEIFDIIFSKVFIVEREEYPTMGEVKTKIGGNL